MPAVAIVNCATRTEGTRFDAQTFKMAFRELGCSVTWYQGSDYGRDAALPERDQLVPGAGIPLGTLDMGLNRLWIFPRRLQSIPEDRVLLMDPTLVNVARFHARTAVRIHDLRPLTKFADRVVTTRMFRYALPRLRQVCRVLVPTISTAVDLAERGILSERIRVVPETHLLGVHPEHIKRSLERIQGEGELRVLYVAEDRPFKNIALVLRLAAAFTGKRHDPRIRFTIVSRLRPSTAEAIERAALPNLAILRDPPSMTDVYAVHDVLVYPSLYEGFGRPVIEAMSFGLPIVASRIPPLDDIVGDSGMLLDPGKLADWVEALERLSERTLYLDYAERALHQQESYSPSRFREALAAALNGW